MATYIDYVVNVDVFYEGSVNGSDGSSSKSSSDGLPFTGVQVGDAVLIDGEYYYNSNGIPSYSLLDTEEDFSSEDYPKLSLVYPSLVTPTLTTPEGSYHSYKIIADLHIGD